MSQSVPIIPRANPAAFVGTVDIPVPSTKPNPKNPRRVVLNGPGGSESVAEMVKSLRAEGMIEPVVVREVEDTPLAGKFYQLIAGERRWRAFKAMGIESIPARVVPASEAEAATKCIIACVTAKGAGPMEFATAVNDLLGVCDQGGQPAFTIEGVAERVGLPVDKVRRLRLLVELPEFAQTAVIRGQMVESVAALIARLPDPAAREELSHAALRQELTVRGVQSMIEESHQRSLLGAPFDPKDRMLLPGAGSCETCPHRTGANPERFGESKGPAARICTQPACFRQKVEAARRVKAAKLEAEGYTVLGVAECDREFPAGLKTLRHDSPYIRPEDPVPPDLLKREVAAHGSVTWAELLVKTPVQPTRYAGFNQDGAPEELLKQTDAIAAIDAVEGDKHVFRESDHKATRAGAAAVAPAAQPRGTRRAESGAPDESEAGSKPAAPVVVEPDAKLLAHELSQANALLVEIHEELQTRKIKLTARPRLRLETHLRRHKLITDKDEKEAA